ncbi:MAG: hypothetical protein Q7W45_02320 [Bacteroidota bacterium]|nr:hypothetical protein [Bacteroidota bacterium]MDP3145913.1 hypothetical protein [Bacteroidota bacterium]
MSDDNPIETRTSTIFLDEHGIIIITMKNCGLIDEYDVIDANFVIRFKANQKPAYKLLEANADWDLNEKAKARVEMENSKIYTAARAIVVSNKLKATVLKYLQKLSKKEFPQKFFTSKEEAHKWLLELKNKK